MNKKMVSLLVLFGALLIILATSNATPVHALDVEVDGSDVSTTTITFDVDDGSITITATGIDTSSWHTGDVGHENQFRAEGSFTGTYSVSQGTYGGLGAFINADASSDADFYFEDYLDFNVLSGNHIYDTEGWFGAMALGDGATMNLKSVGSMYVWSEATNPYWKDPIGGNVIGKYAYVEQDGDSEVYLEIYVETEGYATMDNSNIWGWGIGETGTATTHYNGGTRYISATEDGYIYQEGFGNDFLEFYGLIFDGGGAWIAEGYFFDGLSGTYSMEGN